MIGTERVTALYSVPMADWRTAPGMSHRVFAGYVGNNLSDSVTVDHRMDSEGNGSVIARRATYGRNTVPMLHFIYRMGGADGKTRIATHWDGNLVCKDGYNKSNANKFSLFKYNLGDGQKTNVLTLTDAFLDAALRAECTEPLVYGDRTIHEPSKNVRIRLETTGVGPRTIAKDYRPLNNAMFELVKKGCKN